MQPSTYLPILLLLLILYLLMRARRAVAAKRVMKKRRSEERTEMVELAKRFIGKECILYAFDSSHQFTGVIEEVSDHAVLLEKNGTLETVNLDYVIRIREYPKNKNGKKKSMILD